MSGTRLVDKVKLVTALKPAIPSSASPAYVSLKDYNHLTIVVNVSNATTVTGSAITLNQATAVAGTSAKALGFTKMWSDIDCAAADALAQVAVVSNTFTTDATNSKVLKYVIEVDAADLDVTNGFNCVQVGVANATAATVSVEYILSGARFGGNVALMPSAILD